MLAMAGSSQFITQYAGKLLQVDNKRNNMRWCKKKKKSIVTLGAETDVRNERAKTS